MQALDVHALVQTIGGSFHEVTLLTEQASSKGIPCSAHIKGCLVISNPGDSPHELYALIPEFDERAKSPPWTVVQVPHPNGEERI